MAISAVRKSGLDASIRKSSQLWYMNRNTNKVNLFSIHKLNVEKSLQRCSATLKSNHEK